MKLLIVAVIVCMLRAVSAGCSELYITSNQSIVVMQSVYKVMVSLTPQAERLRKFIARYNQDDALLLAELIASCENPKDLAVIGAMETRFRDVLGAENCVGRFQVQPQHHGPVPKTMSGQIKQADGILSKLKRGNPIQTMYRKYNGAGPEAVAYSERAMALRKQI